MEVKTKQEMNKHKKRATHEYPIQQIIDKEQTVTSRNIQYINENLITKLTNSPFFISIPINTLYNLSLPISSPSCIISTPSIIMTVTEMF